jgi:hypothetical protein
MDYRQMTAPCGLDCFNCPRYLANENERIRAQLEVRIKAIKAQDVHIDNWLCKGCRNEKGKCVPPNMESCKAYKCVMEKGLYSCADCSDFPCDNLQPFAEHAQLLPHNMKVYNLALIKKMGVEKWAQEKSKQVRDTYFDGKFNI